MIEAGKGNAPLGPEALSLSDLRQEIEKVDADLLRLFLQRMQVAQDVARYKMEKGREIFDARREQDVIEAITAKAKPQDRLRVKNLFQCLMRLSREKQYELLLQQGQPFALGEAMKGSQRQMPENPRIVCQGAKGSYSEQASDLFFAGKPFASVKTFEAACRKVDEGKASVAVLPLENSTAGTVDDVYDLLLKHDLQIWRSALLPIRHELIALAGAELGQIEKVISHPQALAQCSDLIRAQGWQTQESLNTAFAARMVAEGQDPRVAAIASKAAAKAHRLQVLMPAISNSDANQTRFIAAGKTRIITEDADRVSLILRLPHQSGSLATALSIFADRGLNLTKIQSRPDPASPWTYLFYLDFAARRENEAAVLATLYHLHSEMPYLRFLGWYREQTPSP